MRFKSYLIAVLTLFGLLTGPVTAQEWPKLKPVTFIVPTAAGGSLDRLARLIANHLSTTFDARFLVEPRPGAAGNIAGAIVARAPPDGYTLLITVPSIASYNKLVFPSLPFDPETDFTNITKLSEVPLILMIRKDFPVETFHEFLSYVRANPGKVTFGTGGYGTMAHIAMMALSDQARLDMSFVPYSTGILQDLLSGNLDCTISFVSGFDGAIRDKRLKVLAIASEQRSPLFPDVPTMRESGVDFVATPWLGLAGPKGLPADIVRKMSMAIGEFLRTNEKVRSYLASVGEVPAPSTPEEFDKAVKAEMTMWSPIIRKYNIRGE